MKTIRLDGLKEAVAIWHGGVLYPCKAESDSGGSGFLKVRCSVQVEEEPECLVQSHLVPILGKSSVDQLAGQD